ncbi:unnamed protein product, partial [Rotaria magnacalcarata]
MHEGMGPPWISHGEIADGEDSAPTKTPSGPPSGGSAGSSSGGRHGPTPPPPHNASHMLQNGHVPQHLQGGRQQGQPLPDHLQKLHQPPQMLIPHLSPVQAPPVPPHGSSNLPPNSTQQLQFNPQQYPHPQYFQGLRPAHILPPNSRPPQPLPIQHLQRQPQIALGAQQMHGPSFKVQVNLPESSPTSGKGSNSGSNLNLSSSGHLSKHPSQDFYDHQFQPHSDPNGNSYSGARDGGPIFHSGPPPQMSPPPVPPHSHERGQSSFEGGIGGSSIGGSNQNIGPHKPQPPSHISHHSGKQHEQQRLSHEQ